MKTDDYSIDGCMEMYGAHIKVCIKDYADIHRHYSALVKKLNSTKGSGKRDRLQKLLRNYESARDFLFGGGIEDAIDRFSLPLDAEYTRNVAKRMSYGLGVPTPGGRKKLSVYGGGDGQEVDLGEAGDVVFPRGRL